MGSMLGMPQPGNIGGMPEKQPIMFLFLGCGKTQSHTGIHAWTCLEGRGKAPGMTESRPGMIVPHGKHAWNARGMRNMSGMLVHGWVPKAR